MLAYQEGGVIEIKKVRITIWSKWDGLVTEREVLDKDGNLLTPLTERKVDSCKMFVCWSTRILVHLQILSQEQVELKNTPVALAVDLVELF